MRLLPVLGVFALLVVLLYGIVWIEIVYLDSAHAPIAKQQHLERVVFAEGGWGPLLDSRKRQTFYYTAQGTSLHELRYAWFTHLERATGNAKFAAPENLSRLGFLVDDERTDKNPDRLPVGFTQHFDGQINDQVLDITCAACHTGELTITTSSGQHIGLRIDGGQAPHAFTSLAPGQFGASLVASLTATALNPLKFHRFAKQVLGPSLSPGNELALYSDFWSVVSPFASQAISDSIHHRYPVEEGYGRTDAVGRIANHVFGDELDPANRHQGNAPVSYPAVWDIWKFDWVQYTASVAQPLARNQGETLGVGAGLALCDRYGRPLPDRERFTSTTLVGNLVEIEKTLQTLHPPHWPNDLLGPIDQKKAEAGRVLFKQHCAYCHEPCGMTDEDRAILVPRKTADQGHWHVKAIPVSEIGTDPTAAENFVNNQYDLSRTGLTPAEMRKELEAVWRERELRINVYRKQHGKPAVDMTGYINQQLALVNIRKASVGAGLNYIGMLLRNQFFAAHPDVDRSDYEGFGALDLPQVKLQYKARPLGGVWATAPYLHNGSVPTLYDMLLPADQRCKKFYTGSREFDPIRVGLAAQPVSKEGMWLDTSVRGNWNIGHEFRKGYTGRPENGVIGPELTDDERKALIEYLKIHTDENPPACQYTYSYPEGLPLKK